MNKKSAFTLAEVLITLVIIGVVAAITLPSVFAEYREAERSGRVKKCYSTLANAMTVAKSLGSDMDFAVVDQDMQNMRDWFDTFLKPSLSTTKVCYNTAGCWSKGDTKYKSGEVARYSRSGIGVGYSIITAVLNDGTFINIDAYDKGDIKNIFGVQIAEQKGLAIYFDINGAREPNTIGYDIFAVVYKDGGLVPAYNGAAEAKIASDCTKRGTGLSCVLKYLAQ